MTNKEAIEELRELIEIDLHPCPPIYEEALNLAIKALEFKYQIIHGDCDYCKYKGTHSAEYPCCICGNREPYQEMWEEEEK